MNLSENPNQVKPSLNEVWASFLDKPEWRWDLYGHFTFRDIRRPGESLPHHVHPESANKTWMKFIHHINRKIYGVRYYKRPEDGVVWARGTELQIRGAIHYHALIGCTSAPGSQELRRLDLMDLWYDWAGIARIVQYEPGKGAEGYLSKSAYAWKRGEIDLGGPLKARMNGITQNALDCFSLDGKRLN